MAQKRVLVIGAILLAAGIGAPSTAFLAPGGSLSEPRSPEVQAPAAPPADDLDPETPADSVSATPTPRRTAAAVAPPPGAGTTSLPVPVHTAAKPTVSSTARDGEGDPPPISGEPPHPAPPAITELPDQPGVKVRPPLPADEMDTAGQ
jgi:hypothetical protein